MRVSHRLYPYGSMSLAENHAGSLPVCPGPSPWACRQPFLRTPLASRAVKFLISPSKRIMIPSRTAAIRL